MGEKNRRQRETRKEWTERVIQERIDLILGKDWRASREFYRQEDRILKKLDSETARQFEEFLSNYQLFSGRENALIYVGGLLDGLRLGAMAFARQLQEEEAEEMEDKEE
mgnify:FL=1